MGRFDLQRDFTVKTTKCRRVAHPEKRRYWGREVVADTPTEHGSKLPPVLRSSSAQRGILIGTVYP